jgi:small subunit ribosomal protein S8e
MARDIRRPVRKASGGFYKRVKGKKLHNLASVPTMTKMGKLKKKCKRILGRNVKFSVLSADIVNVLDPKSKKYSVVKIKTVVDNTANKNFIRRNVMTKGAIVETELGRARITSRPGQEGTVNAVLISK